ncbi:hypothetical protein HJB61_04270 [Rhizobium lentis]|nr:hypothetical protein [Rhizobium lentis]
MAGLDNLFLNETYRHNTTAKVYSHKDTVRVHVSGQIREIRDCVRKALRNP